MGCCSIFNKSLFSDVNIENLDCNIDSLKKFIRSYDDSISGLWLPIIIKPDQKAEYGELLSPARTTINNPFDPCNCVSDISNDYNELESDTAFNCSYCLSMLPTNFSKSWKLKDTDGNESTQSFIADCTSGACDTRMQKDDYLAKIPYINQKYINQFSDFKYLQEFPSITNGGLGFEHFVFSQGGAQLNSFSYTSNKFYIDWVLKPCLSEIPYDPLTSSYNSKDDHDKAYARAMQTNKTCGNFILTTVNPSYSGINPYYPIFSGLIGDPEQGSVRDSYSKLLPKAEDFTSPYGFTNHTYDNIFVKTERLGSYWKWNYKEGILGWYRHFDKDKKDDTRPIKGIDLYIAPGDVFWATNQGPEPPPIANRGNPDIKSCPSGLKLIKNNIVTGVIPSGSEFTYISSNLYSRFLNIYARIDKNDQLINLTSNEPIKKFRLAAMLCTAPQYDEITIDLLKPNKVAGFDEAPSVLEGRGKNEEKNYITINNFGQNLDYNRDMSTSFIGSVNGFGFIKTKSDLINTLANKYGGYLWCPMDSTLSLTYDTKIKDQCYIDLNYDIVVKNSLVKNQPQCSTEIDCSEFTGNIFSYNQNLSHKHTLSSQINSIKNYATSCNNGENTIAAVVQTAKLSLNNNKIKEIIASSGCSIFNNTYPRIITSSSTNSCRYCGPQSSYGLVTSTDNNVCKNGDGTPDNFCDYKLANFYNNSENPQAGLIGTRIPREIIDGTLYFKRQYNAFVFDPRIDKAAFHHQDGVYFESNVFSSISGSTYFLQNSSSSSNTDGHDVSIQFDTKKVGIKLYSVKIEKLRSSSESSADCIAFPNNEPCKCYGLSLVPSFLFNCRDSSFTFTNDPVFFTPNLSTKYGPTFKAYGGYSEDYINKLFIESNNRIPNHPRIGSVLNYLSKKIDPEFPYGCEQSISLNLPNYVKNSWSFTISNFNTNHADVWAEILENVDLFNPNNYSENEYGETEASTNVGYQRFANKVEINNKTLYDKQKKIISTKNDSIGAINVVLTNPYLVSLMGNSIYLYPPSGTFCSNETVYGGRGDELTIVPIKFTRIPRKQILNFGIHPIQPMGTLSAGAFHPNKGLEYSNTTSPFGPLFTNYSYVRDEYYFDYDRDIFPIENTYTDPITGVETTTTSPQRFQSYVFIGDLTKKVKDVLNQIQNLNNDVSKLRLYLNINNQWYIYNTSNLFGYIANNKAYSGPPLAFEYTHKDYKQTCPILIPSSPKKHITFNYLRSPLDNDVFETRRFNDFPLSVAVAKKYDLSYPFIPEIFNIEEVNNKVIRIEGIRPYFMFEEEFLPTQSNATSIAGLESTVIEKINETNPYVHLVNKEQIWMYKGYGDKRVVASYLLTGRGSDSYYDFLYTNFSNLNIDLLATNSDGYIHNSYKKISSIPSIFIEESYSKNSSPFIAKYLKIEYVDTYGNIIKKQNIRNNARPKAYTYFVLDGRRRDLGDLPEKIQQITLYQSLQQTLKKELDPYLTSINPELRSISFEEKIRQILSNTYSDSSANVQFLKNLPDRAKWSDILNFDGNIINDITKYNFTIHDHKRIYPSSLYLNNFYKLIVNSNSNHYNFRALFNGEDDCNYNGNVYYCIHQKYNTENQDNYNINNNLLSNFNNYLPYIDINIFSNRFSFSAPTPSGTVQISGIHQYLDIDHDWESYHNPVTGSALFWINIDPAFDLKSCLTFDQKMYSDTFRIDDVPYQLYDIDCTTNYNADGCRQTFFPTVPNSEITSYNVFNFETEYLTRVTGTSPFVRFPVYCDSDALDTCGSKSCGIKTVGSTSCSGIYKIYEEKNIPITGIPESVPYIISYEGGNYNPLGNNQPHYIQRFELSPENPLIVSSGSSCSLLPLRPKRDSLNNNNRLSVLNEDYQAALESSIVNDHSATVVDTDIFANEMLFRLMYGEKQKINLNTLNNQNQNITYMDLLKHTDPKVTAKDIYKNIPYEYDTTAPVENRIITGSISVQGTLKVGKSVSIRIGSHNLSCGVIKENGDIKIQANYNGESIEGIIHQEYVDNNSIAVCGGPCSSPDSNTTYNLIKTCQELQQYSHSLSRVTTGATLFKQCPKPCDQGCTEDELTDVSFPYWSEPLQIGLGPVGNGPCVTYVVYSPCAGNQGGWYQTNHNVARSVEDGIPQGCSIIASNEAEISFSTYARGAFGGCYPKPMRTQVSADGLFNTGEVEDFNGGLMINQPGAIGDGINITQPSCGTCFTLDYEDPLTKNKLYNVFGGGSYPPYPGNTSQSCECANWEYGYCRNTNNASLCVCNGLQYDYNEFDYNFEYCRYNITLKGYKRRINYPSNNRIITISKACSSTSAGTTNDPGEIMGGGSGGRSTENCIWIECPGAIPTKWHIYDVKSRTQNNAYNPLCPQQLCSVNYTNTSITINLASGQSKCWYFTELTSNNACPLISVSVPDNSFTVSDTIDSYCGSCLNQEPKLTMNPQQQPWDIIEEQRTCVLGYILTDGNPNIDGPVGMGGSVWLAGYCGIRASLCYQREGTGGGGQCGKNAPDSYPWSTCISYSEPSVCVGGNDSSIVGGCNIPVSFPYSNGKAGERIVSLWKKQMSQIWLNTAPCHNNKNKYTVGDIVEGVVPDSCSEVKYTKINYPSMSYRATFGDPVVTQGTIGFTVAYYTYTYRRPKTIQDVFKGEALVEQCNQVTSHNPIGSLNISEKHKTFGCSNVAQCYDTDVNGCDDTNYCCRYGKTNYE